ncbi:TRAP transporter small permease subunit [Reyranella sp.]|uniref:TRAP transporter small permease subunit n=1 Tax=Reyranella sp. TaxID=1929291 RepID=UPI003BA9DDAA
MSTGDDGSFLLAVDRALGRVENLFNDIGGLFIFALMWLTMAEVLGRRLFNSPVPGAIDYIEVGMVVFAFMGAAFCQRQGGHVRMDLVVANLKGRLLWVVESVAVLVAVVYVGIIVWASAQDAWRSYSLGDETLDAHVAVWPSKLVVPIALALLELRLLVNLWGYLRLVVLPDAPPWAVPVVKHVEDVAQDQIREVLGRIDGGSGPANGR